MSLEEKAGFCSGLDYWHTKPIERLGIPSIMVSDGPHGLRSMNRLAVSNDFVFGVNTINNTSILARCEINSPSSDFLSKSFVDIYISEMIVLNEDLYAIFNYEGHKIFLARLSMESLDVL